MNVKNITIEQFENFCKYSQLGNYHQTRNYALLKAEEGFEYEIVGYVDEINNIYAACIVLINKIGRDLYAYIPEGLLVDYSNQVLLKGFSDELVNFLKKKNISFIKINPSVPIYNIDPNTKVKTPTAFVNLPSFLEDIGYKRLPVNLYFESLLPRLTAIKSLINFDAKCVSKNTRNKIKKAIRKGLVLEKASFDKLPILNEFIKNMVDTGDYHYQDYLNIFDKTGDSNLFLVKINASLAAEIAQDYYDVETEINDALALELSINASKRNINRKLDSDKLLTIYKNDVTFASSHINDSSDIYVAGAIVVKHGNKASLVISGYDKNYASFAPNYFLYYALMKYYAKECLEFDMGGISADFSPGSKYYGLNQFKAGFNPQFVEYPGEFDLIINKYTYTKLLLSGTLAKVFNKKEHIE